MPEIIVRFDLRFSRRAIRGTLAAAMLLVAASELNSESVTLTTYYPAPSGVYTQMITTNNTWLARDGGRIAIGSANAPQGKVDITGLSGVEALVVRAVSDTDAIRVTPNADNQNSDAFGVSNAANSASVAYISKNGRAYFGGNVGIGIDPSVTSKLALGPGNIRIDGSLGCVQKSFRDPCLAPLNAGWDSDRACAANQYATATPGVLTEGMAYQSRPPLSQVQSFVYTAPDSLGTTPSWTRIDNLINQCAGTYWCCPR